jgi:hypothetical protein
MNSDQTWWLLQEHKYEKILLLLFPFFVLFDFSFFLFFGLFLPVQFIVLYCCRNKLLIMASSDSDVWIFWCSREENIAWPAQLVQLQNMLSSVTAMRLHCFKTQLKWSLCLACICPSLIFQLEFLRRCKKYCKSRRFFSDYLWIVKPNTKKYLSHELWSNIFHRDTVFKYRSISVILWSHILIR